MRSTALPWLTVPLLAVLALPAGPPPTATGAEVADLRLAGDSPAVTIPFELIDNRIFVDVRVNGRGPFRFILDSGAGNLVTVSLAEALGLGLRDRTEIGGAGSGVVPAWRTDVDSLSIGGLTLTRQTVTVLSLDAIVSAIGFDRLDGLLGYEVFRRLVVSIDYEDQRLTLTRPAAFAAPTAGRRIPFTLRGRVPLIEGRVDSLPGDFILDTGDRSSLTLFLPFQREHALAARYPNRVDALTGWGIGGPIPASVFRVGSLELGGFAARDVVTRLPGENSGAFTAEDVAGSIGTGLLRRFDVVLNYPDRALWLSPNGRFDTPDPWDRAGLWLARQGDRLEVRGVVAGGPADSAGLRVGDLILAVDGVPAARVSLPALRDSLAARTPGTGLTLRRQAGPAAGDLRLVLRDLLPPLRF